MEGMTDKKFGVESWSEAFIPNVSTLITSGDFSRRRKLRVGTIVVSLLTISALRSLLHGLCACGVSNLVCCWLFVGGFLHSFCIAKCASN